MSGLTSPPDWTSPSPDPNDETFGGIVEPTDPGSAGAFDSVLVGEPYDGGVLGRDGAREGPRALRTQLAGTKTHHLDLGAVADVGDLGDVDLPPPGQWGSGTTVADVQESIAGVAARVYESGAFPVFLGGDNSVTVGNARPLAEGRRVGAISIDAHLDCRAVRAGPTSGTPYRQLFEAGLDEFCVIGARHFETSTRYAEWARERGATVVDAEAVAADLGAAIDRVVDAVADVDYVFLSLDLDVLDDALAPGVSAPTPGGLTTREVFELCRRLGGLEHLAGFEVVECAPPLDAGDRTARAGACAIAHVLAGRQSGPDPRVADA